MNDTEWLNDCNQPSSKIWVCVFWAVVALMCICTLIVSAGLIGYLTGFFN